MPLDPWICTAASDLVFGFLTWFRYEQGWQLEDGWFDRRFWLTAVLPVFAFTFASTVMTAAMTR